MKQEEIIERLEMIREALGLNVTQFAEAAGISQGNMSAMLNNKRVIGEGIINKVCMELGVNKRYILTGEGNTFSDSIVTINDCDKLRYTENDSLKYDHEKIKYRLTPPQVIEALACIFTYGLQKYKKEGGWKQVDKERYQDALMRHFQDYLKGNKLDESGFPHSFHVLWNAGALVFKDLEEMGIDAKENLWTHFNSKKE